MPSMRGASAAQLEKGRRGLQPSRGTTGGSTGRTGAAARRAKEPQKIQLIFRWRVPARPTPSGSSSPACSGTRLRHARRRHGRREPVPHRRGGRSERARGGGACSWGPAARRRRPPRPSLRAVTESAGQSSPAPAFGIGAVDPPLETGFTDGPGSRREVVGEILIEGVLRRHPAPEVRVAVTAACGEVVLGDLVRDTRRQATGGTGARSVRGLPTLPPG